MSRQDQSLLPAILDECRRHLRYLRDAADRITWPITPEQMGTPADTLVATLDQFAFRFARLQDILGQKAFRGVLVDILKEPFEDAALRDVLDRLEQLRLLPSADRWEEIRAMRNTLVHDYPDNPAQRAARLNLARPMVEEMAAIMTLLVAA